MGLTDCQPGVLRANGQIIEMCSELGDAEDAVLRLGPGSFDVCLHGILAKLPPAFSCAGKTLFLYPKSVPGGRESHLESNPGNI